MERQLGHKNFCRVNTRQQNHGRHPPRAEQRPRGPRQAHQAHAVLDAALAYYVLASDPKSVLGQQLTALFKATQSARKAFRVGKSFNYGTKISATLNNKVGVRMRVAQSS